MTISRSPVGVTFTVRGPAPGAAVRSLALSTSCLLGLESVEQRVEALEVQLPELAIPFGPVGDLAQRLRPQAADAEAPFAALLDQPGLLEIREVLRDGLLRHLERLGEVADRRRAAREPV